MRLGRFAGFVLAGGTATVCNYSLFALLILLDVHHLLSAATGYVTGIGVSYVINRRWVFHATARIRSSASRYVAVYLTALGIQLLLFEALVRAGVAVLLANALALLLVVVANFWVISRYVFPADDSGASDRGPSR